MTKSSIQQRFHTRAPLDVEITLESEHNFYCGLANDISEGGIFVATYDAPTVGTMVNMDLKLPGTSRSWRVLGIVRWLRELRASCDGCPPGCGIEWVDIPESALSAIGDFVERRDTILYEAA